jgi:hypothetical protein
VKIKITNGKIIVEDDELISNNYPIPPAKMLRQLNITYIGSYANLTLTGPLAYRTKGEIHTLTG